MPRVLVVGGVPNPIGGVTNFIYRLLENNKVAKVVDLYPSTIKVVPRSYKGEVFFFRSYVHFFICFLFSKRFHDNIDLIHFNFSTPSALPFIFLLPKRRRVFALMLHHGELTSPYPEFLTSLFLKKFDKLFCLSSSHLLFYAQYAGKDKCVRATSYLPASRSGFEDVDCDVKDAVEKLKNHAGFCVISGYCDVIYNHHWVVDLFMTYENRRGLIVFLYGDFDAEYYALLKAKAKGSSRIVFFVNKDAASFNFAISCADFYLRPTIRDSFGIAVADAISLGVKVLASDVCDRYPGAYLFTPSSYDCFVSAYFKFIKSSSDLPMADGRGYVGDFTYD